MTYTVYFLSVTRYGVVFCGNATNTFKAFELKKRVIIIMSGAEPRSSCRGQFRKLEILPVSRQYTLSLMLYIIDNQNNFQSGLETHGLHSRSKNQLFIPIANLTSLRKGITTSGILTCNSLPINF